MIHPSAIISPTARIGEGVKIGPYSIVGDHVEIGDATVIGPHVVLTGHTRIGRENRIFQFCSIGEEPQDKKYAGEPTCLEIGDRNTIHEYCSIHIGTVQDQGITRIGNDNWIMGYVHIAHDCVVGNNTVFASGAQVAGHVHVGDWGILGGFAGVHQFVHIGAHSFVGGASVLVQDVPPFVSVAGHPAKPFGINSEGLRRRGFSSEAIMQIKRAYKALYRNNLSLDDAKKEILSLAQKTPELKELCDFLAQEGRGIVR